VAEVLEELHDAARALLVRWQLRHHLEIGSGQSQIGSGQSRTGHCSSAGSCFAVWEG